jgi:hypothetical protein
MKENFKISIETLHCPDRGDEENVHELSEKKLKKREIVFIDIANDEVASNDYKESEDPSKFHSKKTDRGPLSEDWLEKADPVMCAYKLVTVEFKWFGLQSKIESYIAKIYRRMFNVFHRKIFCWIDSWIDLNMDDIRDIEERTKEVLDEQRNVGNVRGSSPDEAD